MNTTAVINIAKGQLCMAEDDYRAMLVRVTGTNSLRQMSESQKLAVVAEMKRLGFKLKVGGKSLNDKRKGYVKLIYALWRNCHRLGVVESDTPQALRAFCKRFVAHGVDSVVVDPDMLSFVQANPIIEALKKMEKRGKAAEVARHG